MTDLVQKLVGALGRKLQQMDMAGDAIEAGRYDEALLHVRSLHAEARAALSEAKAGGWVAVPVEPTPEMLKAAHDAEHCGNHEPHFANAYRAMLAARPLPAPPAQRGEG